MKSSRVQHAGQQVMHWMMYQSMPTSAQLATPVPDTLLDGSSEER